MTDERKKILVMDDEEIVSDIASQLLDYLGYEVELAKDGQEAIELYGKQILEQTPFLLVIMDLNIPQGMGGKETIGEILSIDPKAIAIVSSGYSSDPIMQNYKDYGFSGAIAKPFDLEALKRVLDSVQ